MSSDNNRSPFALDRIDSTLLDPSVYMEDWNTADNSLPILVEQLFLDTEKTYIVRGNNLKISLNVLKNHINYQYSLLSCISGVDFLTRYYRFNVAYDLLSLTYNNPFSIA